MKIEQELMPSLTTFIDFVTTAGSPRVTVVKQWVLRGEYAPRKDFYKSFRDTTINFHSRDSRDPSIFVELLAHVAGTSKEKHYADLINGYNRFSRRRNWTWTEPPNGIWSQGPLSVRVNPELGFNVAGKDLAVKMYLKREPISRGTAELILLMMHKSLDSRYTPVLLDVRQNRLYKSFKDSKQYHELLASEANTFVNLSHPVQRHASA